MRSLTGICCIALAFALSNATTLARAQEPGAGDDGAADPLVGFEVEDGRPGWDGVRLGMSLVQAERRLGATLALASRGTRPVCSSFAAEAEHHGMRLTLGFPSARPGAKIESLWVRFEGQQVAASAAELVVALRRHVPSASYRARPGLAEADDPTPTYLLTADGRGPAVRFVPREGMLVAAAPCIA